MQGKERRERGSTGMRAAWQIVPGIFTPEELWHHVLWCQEGFLVIWVMSPWPCDRWGRVSGETRRCINGESNVTAIAAARWDYKCLNPKITPNTTLQGLFIVKMITQLMECLPLHSALWIWQKQTSWVHGPLASTVLHLGVVLVRRPNSRSAASFDRK